MFKSNLYKETIMASFQELNDAIQSDLPVNEILFKVKQRIDSNKIELQLDSELPASLLCSAAVANRPEIAKFLLDLKLSSNIVNSKKDGFTALHFACGNASKEVVDILLTAGADTLALDKKGRTASQLAQENLYRTYNQLSNAMHLNQPIGDIMYELKKFKSLPLNIIKEDRHTKELQDKLLIIAAQNNYPKIIKDLLEMGANKNAQNKDGATALHFAVSNGHSSVVAILMHNQVDSTIRDNKGHTAVNIAIERDKNVKNKVILEDNKKNSRRSPDSVAKSWSR